jgi:16S rRNA (guanine(966)-N(2))-methyltransferase RsmD
VLDLFCGTGSISFEFASRGCHDIDLVDINGHSLDFIRKTADTLGMKGLNMVRMNAFRFIPVCRKQYDIVFADPPYELENIEQIPELVLDHQLLLPGGLLILEHGKSNNFSKHTRFSEERTYGSVHFTFFK